jgi:hypothetical protein
MVRVKVESIKASQFRRYGLFLLTVFFAWHFVGIALIGPLNSTNIHNKLNTIYDPYLNTLQLNHTWLFYSPNPGQSSFLEYETTNNNGGKNTYQLTQARKKYEHAYLRYAIFYYYLFEKPKYSKQRGFTKSVSHFLCTKHINDNIRSVKFILYRQKPFSFLDYREGKRLMDKMFLKKFIIGPFVCPDVGQ